MRNHAAGSPDNHHPVCQPPRAASPACAAPLAAGDFEGVWVPFAESALICALSNETCKGSADGRHCVFSVFLHEEAAARRLARADPEVSSAVGHELERLFPRYLGQLEPLFVQRWPQALPVYGVGQVTRVKAFWEHGQGERSVWLCGDYLNHPWVEGAVRCGEKVAARISGRKF